MGVGAGENEGVDVVGGQRGTSHEHSTKKLQPTSEICDAFGVLSTVRDLQQLNVA